MKAIICDKCKDAIPEHEGEHIDIYHQCYLVNVIDRKKRSGYVADFIQLCRPCNDWFLDICGKEKR